MAESNPTVRYAAIPGHPGYRVGSDGSVWSRWRSGSNRGAFLCDRWRRLRPKRTRHGRPTVKLAGRHLFVHRLVMLAFVGPCPDGMECLHRDGNRLNNRLGNLRWGTRTENEADRDRHDDRAKGERHGNARLTVASVARLRADYAAGGHTHKSLAAKYHVHPHTVYLVLKRKGWAHC